MLHQQTFDFLHELGKHNSTEWVSAHRSAYHAAVDDATDLASLLVDRISEFDETIRANPPNPARCVTRLTRDMRFAHGRGPYKTDFYIVVGLQGIQGVAASYAVHVEPGNCFAGGGAPNPRGPDLKAYRQKVSDRYEAFADVVSNPSFTARFPSGLQSQSGKRLKGMPRGFSADDPAAEHLKMDGFITRERFDDDALLRPQRLGQVVDLLHGSRPLVHFLNA